MINKKFEAYKIQREIKRSGTGFSFARRKVNKFGEPVDLTTEESLNNLDQLGSLDGIYHENNSYVTLLTSEGSQQRVKKIPMILCQYEDVEKLKLANNDVVTFNNKLYEITGIINIQEWNIIADISLEEFVYGS